MSEQPSPPSTLLLSVCHRLLRSHTIRVSAPVSRLTSSARVPAKSLSAAIPIGMAVSSDATSHDTWTTFDGTDILLGET